MRKGSDFIFESVDLLPYSFHKINLKRGKSYMKSPKWVINKRATINTKNKDNKYENHPQRTSNIKPFIDWKDIDFPAGIKDWKRFERNNKTIALNILSIPHNKKTMNLAYKSKYNRKRENQVVFC